MAAIGGSTITSVCQQCGGISVTTDQAENEHLQKANDLCQEAARIAAAAEEWREHMQGTVMTARLGSILDAILRGEGPK